MHHVLVVDDDEAIRDLVADVLSDDGHRVSVAASAEEALERLAVDDFHLVVTDIRLDALDGIGLLKAIRQRNANLQVVIMTSYASARSAIEALKHGAFDYLTKPFESLDVITETARRALTESMRASEKDLLVASLANSNRQLAELNGKLRDQAARDGLTNLYNHRRLHELLVEEVQRSCDTARDLSILFIDVDHFKRYNDHHGHQRGDEVLKSIAGLLGDNVRSTDVVARWGGEEFVVLASDTDLDTASTLAERLRAAVHDYPFHGETSQPTGKVTISVGVASLKVGGSAESLVGRADRALFAAKSAGRDQVIAAA